MHITYPPTRDVNGEPRFVLVEERPTSPNPIDTCMDVMAQRMVATAQSVDDVRREVAQAMRAEKAKNEEQKRQHLVEKDAMRAEIAKLHEAARLHEIEKVEMQIEGLEQNLKDIEAEAECVLAMADRLQKRARETQSKLRALRQRAANPRPAAPLEAPSGPSTPERQQERTTRAHPFRVRRVKVFCTDEAAYYPGTVTNERPADNGGTELFIEYDDGDKQWHDAEETEIVELTEDTDKTPSSPSTPARPNKRKRAPIRNAQVDIRKSTRQRVPTQKARSDMIPPGFPFEREVHSYIRQIRSKSKQKPTKKKPEKTPDKSSPFSITLDDLVDGGALTFRDELEHKYKDRGVRRGTLLRSKANGLIVIQDAKTDEEHLSLSSWAVAHIQAHDPNRRSCCGWKEVKHVKSGKVMEELREEAFAKV